LLGRFVAYAARQARRGLSLGTALDAGRMLRCLRFRRCWPPLIWFRVNPDGVVFCVQFPQQSVFMPKGSQGGTLPGRGI